MKVKVNVKARVNAKVILPEIETSEDWKWQWCEEFKRKLKWKKYKYENDLTWDRDQWGGLLGRDRAKGSQGAPVMFKLFLFWNIAIM